MKKVLILLCILLFTGCHSKKIKIMVCKDQDNIIEIDKSEYDEIKDLTKRLEFHLVTKNKDNSDCLKLYIHEDGIIHCYWIYENGKIKYDMNRYKNAETFNIEIAKKLIFIIEKTYKQKGVYNK